MALVITGLCATAKDKACLPVCPVDCIFEGEKQLYIHPEQCIDCGACQTVCPVKAIFYPDELPREWAHSVQETADFFARGLPGSQEPARP